MTPRSTKRRTPPPIVLILLGFGLFVGAPRLLPMIQSSQMFDITRLWDTRTSQKMVDRMSFGERLLFAPNGSSEQQQGITAFADGNYTAAIRSFQSSLNHYPNDAETVIYLNNANVGDRRALQIAVSVPIGSNPNVAQEMLRGVAQAQDEVNQKGGINGVKLKVLIANDDNDPEVAKQIAEALANNSDILAVVGHNASNASLAAAQVYQQSGLVMISPTSFANGLSGFGDYIFRTVPNIQAMATPLAEYVVKQKGLQKIAICYDSQAPDNVSFRDEFTIELSRLGGQIAPTVCDFATPTFNPQSAIADIRSAQAQGILLAPHVDRINRATALVQNNQSQLPLFGSPTLYTMQTLQDGKRNVSGLTLSIPWFPVEPFASQARQRWGGTVNWRTANSYDAAQAIIAGLQKSATRNGLQKALRTPSFAAPGAGGLIQFLPSGDRVGNGVLVQAAQEENTGDRFNLTKR